MVIFVIYIFSAIFFGNNSFANQTFFNVVDYGAIGDGVTDDSEAFLNTWNYACNYIEGEGTMVIPENNTFLVQPLTFNGPCNFSVHVLINGVIIAPNGSPKIWKTGNDASKWLAFEGVTSLHIYGSGLINGHGQNWWNISCRYHPKKKDCVTLAPTAVRFKNCKQVEMENISFIDSPQTHILVLESQFVTIRFLNIHADENSPNTDGIHIHDSRNVTVYSANIGVGDDCISIGDRISGINISDINCGPGHGVSIGSLGRDGNEVHVEDIVVTNVRFNGTTNGARIKTWQVGRGQVRHVIFSNINFTAVNNPIIIDQHYCNVPDACKHTKTGVHIEDVEYSQLFGTSKTRVAVNFNCSDIFPCTKLNLYDIRLESSFGSKRKVVSSCNHAFGFVNGTIEPESCLESGDVQ